MEGEKHLFISTPIQPRDFIARLFFYRRGCIRTDAQRRLSFPFMTEIYSFSV